MKLKVVKTEFRVVIPGVTKDSSVVIPESSYSLHNVHFNGGSPM